MEYLREPTEEDCLHFPGTSTPPICAVTHLQGRRCDPCRGASNRASAKKKVENRNERKLNRQQESAILKAELQNVTYTQETINLENAIIKTKINQMKRERDSYLEWRKGQTSLKNNETKQQNNIN